MSEEERELLRQVAALVLLLADHEFAKASATGNWDAASWLADSRKHVDDAMSKAFSAKGKGR